MFGRALPLTLPLTRAPPSPRSARGEELRPHFSLAPLAGRGLG